MTNALANFQMMMIIGFQQHLENFVSVYHKEILVFLETQYEHLEHLSVFNILCKKNYI